MVGFVAYDTTDHAIRISAGRRRGPRAARRRGVRRRDQVDPRTLAENAGLDPIDSLVALRAKYDAGTAAAGLDAYTAEVSDVFDPHVVEPLRVKRQAIDGATGAIELVLRIDVVAAGPLGDGGDDVDF